MADLKMKLDTTNKIKIKMETKDNISMKFDDYHGTFKETDPVFSNSPASKITYQDITKWDNKSDFDGNYNDLYNKPNLNVYATKNELNEGLSNKVDKEEGMGLSQNSFTTEEKTKLASLENYDDTAIVNELNNKADISDIPTKVSELDNDSGFITKDVDDLTNYPTNSAMNAAIAGKQNVIDSDHKLLSDLVDDTNQTNKFVTANDITTWNNKSDFSGNYNDLSNKPTIPTKTSELTNDSNFVTNTDYATGSVGGVVVTGEGLAINQNNGKTYAEARNYSNYTAADNNLFISKGTLENVITGKGLENTYSTSETVCGKWINGKPLYRKVIDISNPNESNTNYEDVGSLNISVLVHLYGYYKTANGTFGIPFNDSTSNYSVIFLSSGGYIRGRFGGASNVTEAKVVIEYTKTTD